MKITRSIKNALKRCLGSRRFETFQEYRLVPRLLLQELRQILRLIRHKRKYADDGEVLLSSLRARTHIVDKGLQADDWALGRGKLPYKALCERIESLADTPYSRDPSFKWACEKKAEYEKAQQAGAVENMVIEKEPVRVSKEDLLHLIKGRRCVRSLDGRPIARETLEEFANVMNWAPTSCNRQPAKLFITQNPEKVEICLRQCAGATCLAANVPCFIAVCADSRFYMLADRYLPFIDASLGIQNLLLLAHAEGIEATLLNWLHHSKHENDTLRRVLDIPDYYTIVLNLAIGYVRGLSPPPGRKGDDLTYVIVD